MPPIKIRSGPLDKFLEREKAKPFNPSSQMPRMLHQMDGNVARRQKPDIAETETENPNLSWMKGRALPDFIRKRDFDGKAARFNGRVEAKETSKRSIGRCLF